MTGTVLIYFSFFLPTLLNDIVRMFVCVLNICLNNGCVKLFKSVE